MRGAETMVIVWAGFRIKRVRNSVLAETMVIVWAGIVLADSAIIERTRTHMRLLN